MAWPHQRVWLWTGLQATSTGWRATWTRSRWPSWMEPSGPLCWRGTLSTQEPLRWTLGMGEDCVSPLLSLSSPVVPPCSVQPGQRHLSSWYCWPLLSLVLPVAPPPPASAFLTLLPRILFWTDWDASLPRIEAASMSGAGRRTIHRETGSGGWPNGLTVDYLEKRILWIDARLALSTNQG